MAFKKDEIVEPAITELMQKVIGLPGYFVPLFMKKYARSKDKLSKSEFMTYWKEFGGR